MALKKVYSSLINKIAKIKQKFSNLDLQDKVLILEQKNIRSFKKPYIKKGMKMNKGFKTKIKKQAYKTLK